MKFPTHKTKIVCTIGPASRSEPVLKALFQAGMNVARLNFSHGTRDEHRATIRRIRSVAAEVGQDCLIFADLPGPKIRIGTLAQEPLLLKKGETLTLTTDDMLGTTARMTVNYDRLPESVQPGSIIYLNDGFIQLTVQEVSGTDVRCRVDVGGQIFSRKGLNLPLAKLFIDPITDRDLALVEFGLQEGVQTFGVSFVECAADIERVKAFARQHGQAINVIAKIERIEAIEQIDEILNVADALMIARGDLGVQIPIEDVPGVQKKLIHKANLLSRPVITATQMLVSMTQNIRPTRAEVTDVANAILDGADAVMLSEETAMGSYPVETVAMMAKIAAAIEGQRRAIPSSADLLGYFKQHVPQSERTIEDLIALNVVENAQTLAARYILTPTHSGNTPRRIARFKPECWILAFTHERTVHEFLALSYGVRSFYPERPEEQGHSAILKFIKAQNLVNTGDTVLITEGVMMGETGWTNSLKILTLQDE